MEDSYSDIDWWWVCECGERKKEEKGLTVLKVFLTFVKSKHTAFVPLNFPFYPEKHVLISRAFIP